MQEIRAAALDAEALNLYSIGIPHVPLMPYPEERPPTGGYPSFIPPQFRFYEYDPLVIVPMIGAATSRIRVGFNVLVTPWVHPYVWAKYLASLDAAIDGRVIAGFGLSDPSPNGKVKALDNFGIDSRTRGRRADEALDLMTKLWKADTPVTYRGQFYEGIELAFDPKPVNQPYVEVWWAGSSRRSLLRAAKYARFLELAFPSASLVESLRPRLLHDNMTVGGHAGIAAVVFLNVTDAEIDQADVWRRYHIGNVPDAFAVGTPPQCADVIRRLAEAGVDHFVLDFNRHGHDSVDVCLAGMERFAKDVLPILAGHPYE
jgi:alkanesulfonate monooxygenase SsuD/methylene tetrahydromethanopterin reductase-like flavin-dependent oxidoreductase (luciferase family)